MTWYWLIYYYNHSHSCLAALLTLCAALLSGQVAQIQIGLKYNQFQKLIQMKVIVYPWNIVSYCPCLGEFLYTHG